jgi:hypothetical protein
VSVELLYELWFSDAERRWNAWYSEQVSLYRLVGLHDDMRDFYGKPLASDPKDVLIAYLGSQYLRPSDLSPLTAGPLAVSRTIKQTLSEPDSLKARGAGPGTGYALISVIPDMPSGDRVTPAAPLTFGDTKPELQTITSLPKDLDTSLLRLDSRIMSTVIKAQP